MKRIKKKEKECEARGLKLSPFYRGVQGGKRARSAVFVVTRSRKKFFPLLSFVVGSFPTSHPFFQCSLGSVSSLPTILVLLSDKTVLIEDYPKLTLEYFLSLLNITSHPHFPSPLFVPKYFSPFSDWQVRRPRLPKRLDFYQPVIFRRWFSPSSF